MTNYEKLCDLFNYLYTTQFNLEFKINDQYALVKLQLSVWVQKKLFSTARKNVFHFSELKYTRNTTDSAQSK